MQDPLRLRRLFPQLAAINLLDAEPHALSALGECADLVAKCHFTALPDTAQFLAHVTRVNSLTIDLQCQPDDFLPLPPLPHLRVLQLCALEWELLMGTALLFVRSLGTLDSIYLDTASGEPAEADWVAFVRELDVRLLTLVNCDDVPHKVQPAWLSIRTYHGVIGDEPMPEH